MTGQRHRFSEPESTPFKNHALSFSFCDRKEEPTLEKVFERKLREKKLPEGPVPLRRVVQTTGVTPVETLPTRTAPTPVTSPPEF